MLGVLSGSCISFLLSRYLFKDLIRKKITESPWLNKNFGLIDDLVSQEGVIVTALARMTFLPTGVTNYVMGVTSIPLWKFLTGTLAYSFNCSMQVFIGCSFY